MQRCGRVVLLAVVVALGGCYELNLKNGGATGPTVERRQSLFALGFYGNPDVDLKRECPGGVGSVSTRFTGEDVLLTIASVGIYSPRTVAVSCATTPRG